MLKSLKFEHLREALARSVRGLSSRRERESGASLIEMMACVALVAILTFSQMTNFFIERSHQDAESAVKQLIAVGHAVKSYCDDNNQQCSNVTMALLVAGKYLPVAETPPQGGSYTLQVTDAAAGTPVARIIIGDPGYYSAIVVWAMKLPNAADNTWPQPSSKTATVQLNWQSWIDGVATST